jgi:recombination protein RecA
LSSAASVLRVQIEASLANRIPGALTMRSGMAPETIPLGIAAFEQRSIAIPRGCLTEICGPPSSGRTTLLLSLMREVTQKGECCALVDTSNAFDPLSALANGVNLGRLLCVRCAGPHPKLTPVEKALRAADWIISGGGFGLIVLDLADLELHLAQKIPVASWYRFQRAVESTSSAFVVMEKRPFAKSCASLVITLESKFSDWTPTLEQPKNPKLLTEIGFAASVSRSRVDVSQRKPIGNATTEFSVATSWAG